MLKNSVGFKTCKICRYFTFDHIEESSDEKAFQCRRHAPQIIYGSGAGWSGQMFPRVSEDTWCGEFEYE